MATRSKSRKPARRSPKRAPSYRTGSESHYRDAAYYDHAYRGRRRDVRFYADFAARHGGPVLELGAGTGRVTFAIAGRGVSIVAVDRMPSMLARAATKLAHMPPAVQRRVTLRRGDLRRLRLRRRFPLVISPFNVLMHLYTRREIEEGLAAVRRHLRPRGLFVFDVLFPDLEWLVLEPRRVLRCPPVHFPADGTRYRYAERFQYDPITQVQLVRMQFEPTRARQRSFDMLLSHRQFFPAELEALLHYNGFDVIERYGGFTGGPLRAGSESQVIVARLAGARRRPRKEEQS